MDFRSNTLNTAGLFTARLIALLALAAIAAQYLVTAGDHPGDAPQQVAWIMLRYFTILTSLASLLSFATMAVTRRALGGWWLGGLAVWEVMTGLVYHLLLSVDRDGLALWADHGLHTALPLAVFAWWAVFARKSRAALGFAISWLIWPALYILYALLRGRADGIYPYFFLDPGKVRWDGVAVWSGMVGLGFLVAGLLLAGVARLIRRG